MYSIVDFDDFLLQEYIQELSTEMTTLKPGITAISSKFLIE